MSSLGETRHSTSTLSFGFTTVSRLPPVRRSSSRFRQKKIVKKPVFANESSQIANIEVAGTIETIEAIEAGVVETIETIEVVVTIETIEVVVTIETIEVDFADREGVKNPALPFRGRKVVSDRKNQPVLA